MIKEHIALHFAAKTTSAIKERNPAVGALSELAENLPSAVQANCAKLDEVVMGALLQAYEMGQANVRETCEREIVASLDGAARRMQLALLATGEEIAEKMTQRMR